MASNAAVDTGAKFNLALMMFLSKRSTIYWAFPKYKYGRMAVLLQYNYINIKSSKIQGPKARCNFQNEAHWHLFNICWPR